MMEHRQRMHGTEPAINWSRLPVSQTDHQPQVYDVIFPRLTKWFPWPFPGLPGSSRMCNGLRSYFNSQNWGGSIRIMEEHPNSLPKCDQCRSQVVAGILNTCHYSLEKCKQGEERRLICEALQRYFKASRVSFQKNVETLPPLEAFPYLGRKLAYNNRYWAAVYQNLWKAWRLWGMLERLLERT